MTKHSKDHPTSSSIQRCEYDTETKEMHITFCNGGTHKFSNVEKEVYDGLANASSPGSHFHQHIRRRYESSKVD